MMIFDMIVITTPPTSPCKGEDFMVCLALQKEEIFISPPAKHHPSFSSSYKKVFFLSPPYQANPLLPLLTKEGLGRL